MAKPSDSDHRRGIEKTARRLTDHAEQYGASAMGSTSQAENEARVRKLALAAEKRAKVEGKSE